MKAMILLGAPGAGKGTVAEALIPSAHLTHVSTGDMLRESVKRQTDIGLQAKAYMDQGELVPDEVIVGIVRERLQQGPGDARYLFDGFPRTIEQADALDGALAGFGAKINAVFLLEVPRDVLIQRLSGRRVCRACGAVSHVINRPTKVAGVCDRCGGETYQRADDNEATVANRLDVYERQTADLISFYERRGVLTRIPADQPLECTERAILERLPKE
jgi:adenylate kinase